MTSSAKTSPDEYSPSAGLRALVNKLPPSRAVPPPLSFRRGMMPANALASAPPAHAAQPSWTGGGGGSSTRGVEGRGTYEPGRVESSQMTGPTQRLTRSNQVRASSARGGSVPSTQNLTRRSSAPEEGSVACVDAMRRLRCSRFELLAPWNESGGRRIVRS